MGEESVFDITIIGAGIVGMATAFRLQERDSNLKILVLDKEKEVSFHQSNRNSGVIHSGIYYEPGSLKATNCVKGYAELLAFCDEYDVPYDLCGKVIVASKEQELSTLDQIFDRGVQNGLKDIQKLTGQEAKEIEPFVHAIKGIHVPQAGIIDYKEVVQKMAQIFLQRGGTIRLNNEVFSIQAKKNEILIECKDKAYKSKFLINCAGLYADKISELTGMKADFKIVPFRGEFYKLKEERTFLVKGLIYPVPDVNFPFLGVHFTKRIHGGVEAGPNAVLAFRREGYAHWDVNWKELYESLTYSGFLRLASRHWKKGFGEMYRSFSPKAFVRELQKLIPDLRIEDVTRSRTGVRAQAIDRQGNMINDYFIRESERIINLCNAPSPAATSALSIGSFLMQKMMDKLENS